MSTSGPRTQRARATRRSAGALARASAVAAILGMSCGGNGDPKSEYDELPPLPPPDATWTPTCDRATADACCTTSACYPLKEGSACLTLDDARASGSVSMIVGTGSGACQCGPYAAGSGPFRVAEGYPASPGGPTPGQCCYVSSYATCP